MMQVVIDGSVDPFAKPISAKPFWIELITCMSINIINNRKQKENWQMKTVNRNGEKKDRDDSPPQQLLPEDEMHKLPRVMGWLIGDEPGGII